MRINENVALSTSTLLLVPYSTNHVQTYHEWMKDPSLQAATASEPLSLEEEYNMQRSWRMDDDKLTFIICSPVTTSEPDTAVKIGVDDGPENMIGDINLFLSEPEDEKEDDQTTSDHNKFVVGEIELMIAQKNLQRKGYGKAAIYVFTKYVLTHWEAIAKEYNDTSPHLAYFRVKINQENTGSIKLFENVGFEWAAKTANYFGEVELRWVPEKAKRALEDKQDYVELNYKPSQESR